MNSISVSTSVVLAAGTIGVGHLLLTVLLLRLYQLVKIKNICQDTWALRIGVILIVLGTLTQAVLPLNRELVFDPDVLYCGVLRIVGLLMLGASVLRTISKAKPWDGKTERRQRARAAETAPRQENRRHLRIPLM